MTKNFSRLAFPLAILLLLPIVGFQKKLDQRKANFEGKTDMYYLPSGKMLDACSMGLKPLLSDLLWIKTLNYVSKNVGTGRDFPWLYQLLDITTDFDPYFIKAYESGGFLLTSVASDPSYAVSLLKKGIEKNPSNWKLQYELAHIYKFYQNDTLNSALMFDRAAQTANTQGEEATILFEQAEDYYTRSGKHHKAKEMWEQFYQNASTKQQKEMALFNIKKVNALETLELLSQGISQYSESHQGKFPPDLNTLVRERIKIKDRPITQIPKDPFDESYTYDAQTGKVSCYSLDRVEHNKRVRFLQNAVDTFHKRFRKYPPNLEILKKGKLITNLILEPIPDEFSYDPKTGKVGNLL